MTKQAPSFERKNFFIDRKMQGRYMLTFLVPMLTMLAFMLVTLYVGSQSIISSSTRIIKEEIDNKMALQLQDNAVVSTSSYENLLSDVQNYLRTFGNDAKYRHALISTLLWVFGIGVFLVIIQVTLLTIYFSHRIAGPVFRFEQTCRAIISGDYTVSIHLRKGDEMQALGLLLNEAVITSHKRLQVLADPKNDEERDSCKTSIKL